MSADAFAVQLCSGEQIAIHYTAVGAKVRKEDAGTIILGSTG